MAKSVEEFVYELQFAVCQKKLGIRYVLGQLSVNITAACEPIGFDRNTAYVRFEYLSVIMMKSWSTFDVCSQPS